MTASLQPCRTPPVPAAPPDSVPASIYDRLFADSNRISLLPRRSDRQPRNVILVVFWASATAAQRRAAIESVCGRVVGGWRIGEADGYYVVEVKTSERYMPTSRAYFEQRARIARDYLSGHVSLQEAARRIAHIMQKSLADDQAWPDDTANPRGHEVQGSLEWFGSLMPEAPGPDQVKLAALMNEASAEWERLEGIRGP